MESDKAMAIGKVIALALSPAQRLMGQVIAKGSVVPARGVKEMGMKNLAIQPVDGRGKSPGSRKTQFKRGHARLGGRRKVEPDLVRLLDQVCDGIRAGDPPKNLSALRTKLEELNQRLGLKAASAGAQRPEPVQESKSPWSEPPKRPSFMICRGCLGQVILEQSKLEPGAVLHHGCGARIRVGLDGGINWF
jgi:hypothetical protein